MKQQNFNHIIQGLKNILEYQDLRKAQIDIFKEFLENPELQTTGIFDLATGFGKTRMMNVLASAFLHSNPQGKIIVVVPTVDLIKDSNGNGMMKRFIDYHQMYSHEPLDIGAFYTHSKQTKNQVIVTTYSSLKNLATKINPEDIGLLLLDEAHHAVSKNRSDTIRLFKNACWYGLTATPAYSPDKDLSALLGSVIAEMNTPQAIKDGLLTSCKNVLLSSKIKVDLSGIKKDVQGNYEEKELETVLQKALKAYQDEGNATNWKNVHNLIAHEIALFYQNYVDETIGAVQNKKCMINCRSQAEARLQAHTLNKVFGKMVAGTWTSDSKDKSVLNKFVNGDLPILCQVGKLSEGFDMPELDMCINYPTCSRVVEAQRGGRVLRLNPQNQSKFSLIVDIVFSHPEYDNPILSSHANGQVLYRDIIGKSSLLSPIYIKNPAISSNKNKHYLIETIHLTSFDIYSNTEDLLKLENEAQTIFENTIFQEKRKGMLTSHELCDIFQKTGYEFFKKHLKSAFHKKETFEVDGIYYPLVEKVKAHSCITLALNEHPQALEIFTHKCFGRELLDLSLKKENTLVSGQIALKFKKSRETIASIFEHCFQENITYEKNGINIPLIEKVRGQKNYPLLVITDEKEALEAFKKVCIQKGIDFETPKKREGMLTHIHLSTKFKRDRTTVKRVMQQLYEQQISFKIDGTTHPLIEYVCAHGQNTLALHEHPQALSHFIAAAKKIGVDYTIKNKRNGMLTSLDLSRIFKKDNTIFSAILKSLFDEKITFLLDEEKLPLVEQVYCKNRVALAVHEHPKALESFLQEAKKMGITLEPRTQKITTQKISTKQDNQRQNNG